MNETGFREYLAERKLEEAKIDEAVSLIERFEAACAPTPLEAAGREDLHAFAKAMIGEKLNEWDHFITLLRYAAFLKNDDVDDSDQEKAIAEIERKISELSK